MNICILSHRYPFKDNMVHVFVKKLVDEWARMGHTCVVISPLSMTHVLLGKEKKAPIKDSYEIEPGKKVVVLRPRFYALPKVKIGDVSMSGYMQQRCVERSIVDIGISFDAFYCHFYQMVAPVWHFASKNNIPLFVATGESRISAIEKPCKSFSIENMKNDLYGVVAVSSKNKNESIELGYANQDSIKVFPNGANLKLFQKQDRQKCRKEIGLPLNTFIVICVGQFVERKGQKRVLEAVDRLNEDNIKTVFIGKGEDQFDHKSILFKGTINNVELPKYLNAADVFVLPTQSEGCCNAIIEALACGLPIISSDRPFNYDVLNAENSILVDPNNIEEIASAIEKLYKDEKLRDFLSQKSYEMGLRLSIEERANNILDFMHDRIKGRGRK